MRNVNLRLCIAAFCLLSSVCSQAAQIAQYRVATWNIEWLTEQPIPKSSTSARHNDDLERLAFYAKQLDADVVAFQEVESVALAKRVFGDKYQIILSDRAKPQFRFNQFHDANQYTGFAIKSTISTNDPADIKLEQDKNSRLRFATYIVLEPENKPAIHALSIHLKAGCSGAYRQKRSCLKVLEQAKYLNAWILQQEAAGHQYLIMGDFNHNLAYAGDWLWRAMSANSQAQLLTQTAPAKCKVRSNKKPNQLHQFRSLIDHIVASKQLATTAQNTEQLLYTSQDVLAYKLSDHCPVRSEFQW